jgi:hypothetical protein
MNFNSLFTKIASAPPEPKAKAGDTGAALLGTFDDQELLDLWESYKKECLDDRWVFERQWHRNILYVLGRQWIEYFPRQGGWKDKRMAPWIPRPVTNKCKETVQAVRAMFSAIKLGVNVRPNGSDPKNVSAASTADDMAPLLHEDHDMDGVLLEGDFWLCVTGNTFLHTFVDYDMKYGTTDVPQLECAECGATFDMATSAGEAKACPDCKGTTLQPALDVEGQQAIASKPNSRPKTVCLSPLEVAFNNNYPRFSEVPYIVRLRWRPKAYFTNHPKLKEIAATMAWQKSPTTQSLELFRSLASHNDLGIAPAYLSDGIAGQSDQDGVSEYEVWVKPCDAYPEGLVFRVWGDKSPIIAHLEDEEGLPGPIPYKDGEGKPLFTFSHAGYEHVGGRILASGPIDVIVQKQDQLNQLDSMIQLIIQRMSNPVWLEPKGAEIEKLTGMPGLVIKWNPLTVGGNAKPERIEGIGPDASLFTIREQYLRDIEELAGTFDIIKGQKPAGVEAFSALQLLVERSQARFATVFTSRGKLYRDWYQYAIELEREFGPNERTMAVLTPARKWTFQNFKRAKLGGALSVIIEDGTAAPKTSLGLRASLEHASQLGMLNMQDPDQRYEGLKTFGLTRMAPSLDINVQSALQKQEAFEEWVQSPGAMQGAMQQIEQSFQQYQQMLAAYQPSTSTDPNTGMPTQDMSDMPKPPSINDATPLKWRKWYGAQVHRQEFLKWANGDRVRELLQTVPGVDKFLDAHLQEMDAALAEEAQRSMMLTQPPAPATPTSGGMQRSNSNSGTAQHASNESSHGKA